MTSPSVKPYPEDWQSTRRLAESNKYMLDNQIECDVTFSLCGDDGEQVNMHAHKFILISRSPVFFAMLSGPMAERDQKIRVTDISSTVFRQTLGYLYCDDIHLDMDNVFMVLYTAKKYLVTTLVRRCIDFLESQLAPSNVCTYINNSFLFEEEEEELFRSCMTLVRQHSNKVFHSDAFYELSRETLCKILRAESLTVHEIDVFRSCVRWASGKCSEDNIEVTGMNKRQMLGDALKYIHFPTLSINEFTKFVVPAGILNTDEENAIFRCLLNSETTDDVLPCPFPTRSREKVECNCVATYTGFLKHTTSFTSLFQGMPQRSRWSLNLYTDQTIKLRKITFLGKFKGTVCVSQNNLRKFEVSCNAHMNEIELDDEGISLDTGLFTIASEAPFSYVGEYYSKSVGDPIPGMVCDQDQVVITVKESTPLCFLASFVFLPSDEMHFVENYFCSD